MTHPKITASAITHFVKRMSNIHGLKQTVFRVETVTTKSTGNTSGHITSHISFDRRLLTEKTIPDFCDMLLKGLAHWRDIVNDQETTVIFKAHVF